MSEQLTSLRAEHTDGSRRSVHSSLALVVTLGIAAALRLYRLGAESIWLDEALAHHHATTLTTTELLVWLPQRDPNPPLYFLALSEWTALVGDGLVAMRALSALFGVLAVALVFLVGRRLFDRRAGFAAAAFLAVSPFHVFYGQEARMYALLTAAALASYLFLLRIETGGGRVDTVGYVLSTVVLVHTHTYGLFVVGAQALYLLSLSVEGGRAGVYDFLRRWTVPVGVTAVLSTPWIALLALRVFGGPGQTAGVESGNAASAVTIPTPGVVSLPTTYLAHWVPLGSLVDGVGVAEIVALGGFAVIVLGCLVGLFGSAVRTDRFRTRGGERSEERRLLDIGIAVVRDRRNRLLLTWAVVPVLVPFVLSYTVTPIFVHRYTIGASLAVALLAGGGLTRLERGHVRYAAVAIVLVGAVASLPAHYGTDQKEQWREATATVEEEAAPGDLVIVSTDSATLPYDYHATRGDLVVVPVPEDATRAAIDEHLDGEHRRVWFVASHLTEGQERRYRSVLGEGHTRTETQSFTGVRVYEYVNTASPDASVSDGRRTTESESG
ncbi:glycosyltransferase family 39 protein [Halomarina oriensis]|uniref:Glycosyltransferase RgtA/B/C/D-like domain-containing protein n=1 Tax=Halomarina oriensis TaxID=671145 RepID=A0A6B0GKV8_9EURY|nr:glycosyltransferase family 39 protein [Halomarina oriensis]MWG33433.1 hypothetical protein [Halomarina oriensis]